jgi:hypothetical protein
MPVIVVGADTPPGLAICHGLYRPSREVRAFVSDDVIAAELRQLGLKVALGDVSDDSHVEAATTRCFSAVLVAEAAVDGRERAFATGAAAVLSGWARAITAAGVTRAIWVMTGEPPTPGPAEMATVDPEAPDLVARVVSLDDAQTI